MTMHTLGHPQSVPLSTSVKVYPLGQVGYLFERAGERILIDPYLTDSVAEQFGPCFRRLAAPTLPAESLTDVSWVLITHAHLDHADPESLRLVRKASPSVRFLCPYEVEPMLEEIGVPVNSIHRAPVQRTALSERLNVRAIPAAHTALERDETGALRYVGYLLQWEDLTVYHAGDTVPHAEIFTALAAEPIDFAFLPVNERNFFRDEAGIIGNMSVREAVQMADRLGAHTLVPTHWDLFAPNSVFHWEIERLHQSLSPRCQLRFLPCGDPHQLKRTA